MKGVLGENGHEAVIFQCSVKVEASNKAHVAELAKFKFCEAEKVKSRLLHTDHVHVTDSEFPS
jgi:hypothetical protein